MSLIINNNGIFQLPSQPFSTLVPSGWIQAQEYEQFLDYLAQQFNDFHENVNSVLDFFDVNKCPERFLKIIAFNLGMEIPLDEDLSPRARALINYAIRIYKTKGTFDKNNTSLKGIGLWIKMATGYDITVISYPLLNPYMFVDQFNYRCAKLRAEGGSVDPFYQAIHPYEKDPDGTGRIMYLHELPKYASQPEKTFHFFGAGDNYNGLIYLFDYKTQENVDIALPRPTPPVYTDYIMYFYDNRIHLLFGTDDSSVPAAKVMILDFPVYYNKSTAIQQTAWETKDAPFPDGITSIKINKSYQIFTFRNYVYFVGIINGTDIRLCRFDNLTRLTEIIDIDKTLLTGTVTAFSRTKFYFILTESGITTLYCYDLILDELTALTIIPSGVASLTFYSMISYQEYLFLATQDNKLFRYDIMYDVFTELTLDITGYSDTAYLAIHQDKVCVQKSYHSDLWTYALFTVDVLTLISAKEKDVITIDSGEHIIVIDIAALSNVFSTFMTAGHVVYPSTLVINVKSYGEFTTSRSLYARKMQTVKEHLDKYIQSGVLAIINDDN